jgi:hypothetical protein
MHFPVKHRRLFSSPLGCMTFLIAQLFAANAAPVFTLLRKEEDGDDFSGTKLITENGDGKRQGHYRTLSQP